MRVKRTIIIPVLVALSAAGSMLAGTATAATAQGPSTHVVAASHVTPEFFYHA